jgi:hypothetical protein
VALFAHCDIPALRRASRPGERTGALDDCARSMLGSNVAWMAGET